MLSWFVHGWITNNQLTPNYILVLFIVSVLGAVWAIATLFLWHRSRSNSAFVAFIDLCFVGAFIAGVYELRGIASADCMNWGSASLSFNLGPFTFSGQGLGVNVNKTCSMLKTCFAFGIMNCIFFFITALLAWMHHPPEEVVYKETRYSSRHGHRRSHSGGSRRSSHSHRRAAYV